MTIKEFIRKNYAYILPHKSFIIMVNGDCFTGDSLSGIVEKPEYADLLNHEFVGLARAFDYRNRESYFIIGRTDV